MLFQSAEKFNYWYSTLGFNDPANLDEGGMWPTAFAVMKMTPAVEKEITASEKGSELKSQKVVSY